MSIEYIPEIWTPRIGQRVRVKLSPECRVDWAAADPAFFEVPVGHPAEFDGVAGRVGSASYYNGLAVPDGHAICINFDDAIKISSMYVPWDKVYGGLFAPHELVPVFALGDRVRIRAAARYCPLRHVARPGQHGTITDRTDSPSGHTWTVSLDEAEAWESVIIDELQDEEMEPYDD